MTARGADSSKSNSSSFSNGIGVTAENLGAASIDGTAHNKCNYDSEYDSDSDEEVFTPPADNFNLDDLQVTLGAIRSRR